MQSKQKRINKTISLASSTHDLLDRTSNQLDIPASRIIERLITLYIMQFLDEKKIQYK